MALTENQRLLLGVALTIFGLVLLFSPLFLFHATTDRPSMESGFEGMNPVYRYTMKIVDNNIRPEVTYYPESFMAHVCPPVIKAMISLENQALANWTYYRGSRSCSNTNISQSFFVTARIKLGEHTIESEKLYSYVERSPENVTSWMKEGKQNSSFFSYAHCKINVTSEDPDNWNRSCTGVGRFEILEHEGKVISAEEFRRESGMLGIQKTEFTIGIHISRFIGGIKVVNSVQTLKDGWTTSKFSSNLISYEEERKAMCLCRKTLLDTRNHRNISKACSPVVRLRQEFRLLEERPLCFPDPEF